MKRKNQLLFGLDFTRPDISLNMLTNAEKEKFSYVKLDSFENDMDALYTLFN